MKKSGIEICSYRKAVVLVAVLWVVALLIIIISVLARTSRLDTRVTLYSGEKIRCKWACRAGVETAIAVLNDDDEDTDSFYDLWYNNETDFNDIPLDACKFYVEVIDESGKLNINTATDKQLAALPDMTGEIVNSILDWRDDNDTVSTGGAEAGYYLNLPFGYQIRNSGFKTVREILRVKGVTEGLLYGYSTVEIPISEHNSGWINYLTCYSYEQNTDAEGNRRVNVNKENEKNIQRKLEIRPSYAKWIVENRGSKGFKSIADLLNDRSPKTPQRSTENSDEAAPIDLQTYLKILDKITVSTERVLPAKVNINTAPLNVLIALFEGNDELAEEVFNYRENQITGILSLEELTEIKSMDVKTVKKYINHITLRSSIFTVKSTAVADATKAIKRTEAVVDRSKSPVEILYYCTGAYN